MDLATLIAAARKVNPRVSGVAVVNQWASDDAPFIAVCVLEDSKFDGRLRSWDTHPTPEAALQDLAEQLAK